MRPLFVRELTDEERAILEAGRRSSQVFTVKRCQILLASAGGQNATAIGATVGYSTQTVRNVVTRVNEEGLAALKPRPSCARRLANRELDTRALDHLRALRHKSPRSLGIPRSTWTLATLAVVCHRRGLTSRVFSEEAVRKAIKRLGVGWKRAKAWITSPDPADARKKSDATN
jgi:transposase